MFHPTFLLLRFANMLHLSGMTEDVIMKTIVEQKIMYIRNNSDILPTTPCFISNNGTANLFDDINTGRFLNYLKQYIPGSHQNDNYEVNHNITNEFLKKSAEMFIYSFQCPKFMYDWTMFYIDLMQNASPDIIVLTLNRALITGRANGHKTIMKIAKKLLQKISQQFSLQFSAISFTKKVSVDDKIKNNSTGVL